MAFVRSPLAALAAPAVLVALVVGCGGSSHGGGPPGRWRLVPTASLPSGPARFAAVSCVSASYCIAVGSRFRGLVDHTLAERWDGATWSVLPTKTRGDRRSGLTGVSCVSETFCVAVGS